MKRKKAKIILFFYKILKYFLLYLTLFLGVVICFMVFDFKLPFFPVFFLWSVFIFGGYPLFMYLVFKKDILIYTGNVRKCIKHNAMPIFLVSLIACAFYWKWSYPIARALLSAAWKGVLAYFS